MPLKKIPNSKYLEAAKLISRSETWMHRKVETWTFSDDGTTKRSLSFDLTVKEPFKSLGYVPLTFLDKTVLKSLDVRAADGSALSTLTIFENADLSVRLLASALKISKSEELSFQWQLTELVNRTQVKDSPEDNQREFIKMSEFYLNSLPSGLYEDFGYLVKELFSGFILWVRIPDDIEKEKRTIFKIAYNLEIEATSTSPDLTNLGLFERFKRRIQNFLSALPYQIDLNTKWGNRYHLEIRAPLGFVVNELTIFSKLEHSLDSLVNKSLETVQVSHLALDANRNLNSQAEVLILAGRRGFFNTVRVTTHSIFTLLIIPLIIFKLKDNSEILGKTFDFSTHNGSAVTLLLLGPAILITFLATTAEHSVIAKRRSVGRISLYVSGALLIVAAFSVSGAISSSTLIVWAWILISIIGGLNSALTEYWFRHSTIKSTK